MARNTSGSKKFSFPLPRRSKPKPEQPTEDARSIPLAASGPERPSRHDEPASKAHRILGTSDSLHRSASAQNTIPSSPGYMSITISEASFGSQIDDRNPASTAGSSGHLKRPDMLRRASSNLLGATHTGDGRQGSDQGSASHRLYPQTSSSTLRSHYDAKSSPLYISQQTSDSAVRDRALRRGYPPVLTDRVYEAGHEANPVSPAILDETRKRDSRKSKPARLDLSKLFPKPRDNQRYDNAMLSPAKMVNSPAAMSVNSEYFHRPASREQTPPAGTTKLQKTNARNYNTSTQPLPSPIRKVKRDEYDNAKVHVRRPPKGVQHWFDALDEESDDSADETQHVSVTRPVRSNTTSSHTPSVTQTSQPRGPPLHASRSQDLAGAYKRDSFALEDLVDIGHLTSPSEYSLNTYRSQNSTRTKESALANTNLQDSSVLSFSSSEDEGDGHRSRPWRAPDRKSMDSGEDTGEILIGRAQAYEVRAPHYRQQSAGKMSTFSTSTNAATIEVMYTPESPFPAYQYPRNNSYSSVRRSSHVRQPSVILEDEDTRPKTAVNMPLSPSTHSVQSARTSASAPQPQFDSSHKFMQVTAEEEALLELMRKKRAAMNRMCAPEPSTKEPEKMKKAVQEASAHQNRTPRSLPTSSSEPSSARKVDRSRQRASTSASLPLQPTARGRSHRTNRNVSASRLRDSSTGDDWSDRHHSPASRGRQPRPLPPSFELSAQKISPPSSPTVTASGVSPTTTDRPSLPSPITPGPCDDEADIAVKVANSDTSNDIDDIPALDSSVVSAPSESIKSNSSRELSGHRRRRTASSGAEMMFPNPPGSTTFKEMAPVPEASSRPPSIIEPPAPKPSKKVARHISELALASIETRSRQSSVHSTASRTSGYSQASSYVNSAGKTRARHLSPDHITSNPRTASPERDSVCDDVLAAWNSLGGTY
ncbi:hypothetical protein TW65_01189 [Stemphylium lycopersici]|uniref:Uncharacterized protein n=1 Tax=Stemphylium lycopersici TaxID=183478 RepID=A0A364NH73_STELY|nr:hypothetical protein TW65_01189 [Stemphylium lycopersici]RAR16596.1 hypothetical protein DDE83_000165 [Stemphylium lycopersici]